MSDKDQMHWFLNKEKEAMQKEILELNQFLRAVEEDNRIQLSPISDKARLSHRLVILQKMGEIEKLEKTMENIYGMIKRIIEKTSINDPSALEKHNQMLAYAENYLKQIKALSSGMGELEKYREEAQRLVSKHYGKDNLLSSDEVSKLINILNIAVNIVKRTLIDVGGFNNFLDKLSIIDIEYLDENSYEYFKENIEKMYWADQGCRPCMFWENFSNRVVHKGLSGEYSHLNGFQIDLLNQTKLVKLLEKHPIPTIKDPKLVYKIFLIVQHCDNNPNLQKICAEQLFHHPSIGKKDLAYLKDRIEVNSRNKQIYGTQFAGVLWGVVGFYPIEGANIIREETPRRDTHGHVYGEMDDNSIRMVDERRASIGFNDHLVITYRNMALGHGRNKIKGRALMYLDVNARDDS